MPGFKAPEVLPILGKPMKVELDRQSLFALASDTRLEMLKALQTNRRTVSQLAELLGIDKAAVHRHLKKLEEGGFVTRTEDHGFVYYALTWRSRDILNPNDRTKIVILISSSLVCVLGVVLIILLASFSDPAAVWTETNDGEGHFSDGGSGEDPGMVVPLAHPLDPMLLTLVTMLGIAAVALIVAARSLWRLPCQRGGETSDDSQSSPRNLAENV